MRFYLFLLCSVLGFNLAAQQFNPPLERIWTNTELEDSVRFEAIKRHYSVYGSDLNANLELTKYHYRLAEEKGNDRQKIKALEKRSLIEYYNSDYSAAKSTLEKRLILVEKSGVPLDKLNVLLLQSGIALDECDFRRAIDYINKSYLFSIENGLKKGEVTSLLNKGIFFDYLQEPALALSYFDRADSVSIKINSQGERGLILMNKAMSYHALDNYQESIACYVQAIDFFSYRNNDFQVASCYSGLAKVNKDLKRFSEALDYIKKSQDYFSSQDSELMNIDDSLVMGEVYLELDISNAEVIYSALERRITDEIPNDLKARIYHGLFTCYKKLKDSDKSLFYHEKYKEYSDKMLEEERDLATLRESISFEFDLEQRADKLENLKVKDDLEKKNFRKVIVIISVSLVIILLLVYFFYRRMVKVKRTRKALLDELEELKKGSSNLVVDTNTLGLNRNNIEDAINRSLNDTDWRVLNVLFEEPLISNKEIGEKVYRSTDGVVSSLRRMYEYFDIQETKYKKIALLMSAIKKSSSMPG